MTRTYASGQPELAIRPRATGDGDGCHREHTYVQSHDARAGSDSGYLHLPNQQYSGMMSSHMYHFGTATASYSVFPATSEVPEDALMDYGANLCRDMEGGEDLLSAFMSDQVAETNDLFESTDVLPDEFFTKAGPASRMASQETVFNFPYVSPPGYSAPFVEQTPRTDLPAHNNLLAVQNDWQRNAYGPAVPPQPGFPKRTYPSIRPKVENAQRAAPPDTSNADEANNGRGRKRALSPDGRKHARHVRSIRACGRCHELKARCDVNRPCKPCLSTHKRALDFPCMSELPAHRWTHLFTDEMYGHLDLRNGEFMNNMPKHIPGATPFLLRLHQYFDDPELVLPVIRFNPNGDKDTRKSVFPIESTGGEFHVQPGEILSPPLVPAITNAMLPNFTKRFRWTIRRWLDCAEVHDDLEWHKTFFREEYGKPWPREILGQVCQYYHQVEWKACDALKSSLQATIFAYMLGHSFYVPHEDIQGVLDKTGLASHYDGEFMFVSPIHIDRFVKALLYPVFRRCVGLALKQLQDSCAPNKLSKYARDQILATSIVLLIVAASQQSKAIEKAVAMRKRGNIITEGAVWKQIWEIEEYIIDLILVLWSYKFGTEPKWASDEPRDRNPAYRAKIFRLLDRFRESYDEYEPSLRGLPTRLPERIDERTFGATNIDRVLKKFYECVFLQLTSASTSVVESGMPTPLTSPESYTFVGRQPPNVPENDIE